LHVIRLFLKWRQLGSIVRQRSVGDHFLSALERLLDDKFEIMQTMTAELGTTRDSSAIPDVFRRAVERFRHFRKTAEIPFEQQFGDRITAASTEAQSLMEKHRLSFATFLSGLQRLKYDEPYVGDLQVAAAVAEFERATAGIPARTPA
jgi:hypothetical protein